MAQNFLEIAKQGLDRRNILANNKTYNETYYLKDLEKNLNNGNSPADILINKFNNQWGNNIEEIYREDIF